MAVGSGLGMVAVAIVVCTRAPAEFVVMVVITPSALVVVVWV